MKTISLDISESFNTAKITDLFEQEHLEQGDHLILLTEDNMVDFIVDGLLLSMGIHLIHYYIGTNNLDEKRAMQLRNELVHKFAFQEDIKPFIETNTGVKIDLAVKPSSAYDPIEDGFGLWEDNPITLDEIRSKAWGIKV